MSAANTAGAVPDTTITWHDIDWVKVYRTVRRLQVRIAQAVLEGKWHKVKALVYILTHSFSGRALAILRVTTNQGANTPGIDKVVWSTPELKEKAFSKLRNRGYRAQPLRRLYIPKKNGGLRPLGIPIVLDRAQQALHLLGLAPIVETLADPHSYGFREERGCRDALSYIFTILSGPDRAEWIFEADIKSCFDRIDFDWLMSHIPMNKTILRQWLKAGYLEKNAFHATESGTPQGGIISPALANMALDGLQALLYEQFKHKAKGASGNKVNLARYADDFIITGTSELQLKYEVAPLVREFLRERGLELSAEKTRITHITEGFDFLGQTIRRYRDGKLLLKPSRNSVKRFLREIRELIRTEGRSLSAGDLIQRLNPKIRGWAMYHRHASSKRTFQKVDHAIFQALWRWARRRHSEKSASWVKSKYFADVPGLWKWTLQGTVYTALESGEYIVEDVFLTRASYIRIERHRAIKGEANPYAREWETYFEDRITARMRATLKGQEKLKVLWDRQGGRCPVCKELLTWESGWQIHHWVWRVHGGEDTLENLGMLHVNCHRQIHHGRKVDDTAASSEREA